MTSLHWWTRCQKGTKKILCPKQWRWNACTSSCHGPQRIHHLGGKFRTETKRNNDHKIHKIDHHLRCLHENSCNSCLKKCTFLAASSHLAILRNTDECIVGWRFHHDLTGTKAIDHPEFSSTENQIHQIPKCPSYRISSPHLSCIKDDLHQGWPHGCHGPRNTPRALRDRTERVSHRAPAKWLRQKQLALPTWIMSLETFDLKVSWKQIKWNQISCGVNKYGKGLRRTRTSHSDLSSCRRSVKHKTL